MLRVSVDDRVLFAGDPIGSHDLVVSISDDDGQHQLQFQLSGKTSDHTEIGPDGNILQDTVITVSDIAFDEIQLGHMVSELSSYQHDLNGTGPTVQDQFFGVMGCNGTMSLPFTTPIYLWLLENM